jgi:hypothetical protein
MPKAIMAAVTLLTLTACGGRENELRHLRSTEVTAREVAVQPGPELRIPSDLNALPPPAGS